MKIKDIIIILFYIILLMIDFFHYFSLYSYKTISNAMRCDFNIRFVQHNRNSKEKQISRTRPRYTQNMISKLYKQNTAEQDHSLIFNSRANKGNH